MIAILIAIAALVLALFSLGAHVESVKLRKKAIEALKKAMKDKE